jgi:uncharacterized protein (TIGR00369 family)
MKKAYFYRSFKEMKSIELHTLRLKRIYESAPVNQLHFKGTQIQFSNDQVEINFETNSSLNHAGGSVHGSVAFKLLDDAAYFSCQMFEMQYLLLTASFQIHFVRPVKSSRIIAIGKLRQKSKNLYVAEAMLIDEQKKVPAVL